LSAASAPLALADAQLPFAREFGHPELDEQANRPERESSAHRPTSGACQVVVI